MKLEQWPNQSDHNTDMQYLLQKLLFVRSPVEPAPFKSEIPIDFHCKVLSETESPLCEHKRHTTHHVASAHYAALSHGGGTLGTPPPSRPGQGDTWCTPYHPDLVGGYLGYPTIQTWLGGTMGTPHHPNLRWGTPLPRPEMGYPTPRPGMGYPPTQI